MMKNIKNKMLHFAYVKFPGLYTYQPGEFLPVYSGGVLLNRKEFIAYKAGKISRRIAVATGRGLQRAGWALLNALDNAVQNAQAK